jgi:hypothetical protein
MALAPEEKISYAVAGPKADAAFEAGAAGFQAKGFRGCGIFTSEPFEVSDDQVRSPPAAGLPSRLLTSARAPPSAGLGPDAHAQLADRGILHPDAASGRPGHGQWEAHLRHPHLRCAAERPRPRPRPRPRAHLCFGGRRGVRQARAHLVGGRARGDARRRGRVPHDQPRDGRRCQRGSRRRGCGHVAHRLEVGRRRHQQLQRGHDRRQDLGRSQPRHPHRRRAPVHRAHDALGYPGRQRPRDGGDLCDLAV